MASKADVLLSAEYSALNEHRKQLVSVISQDPHGVTDMMISKFLISDDLRDRLYLPTLTDRDKARLIVNNMSDLVKQDCSFFNTLLEILRNADLPTEDLVDTLSESQKKCRYCLVYCYVF